MDNGCSYELRNAFNKENVCFQLVPQHVHRLNAAERTICTFKNHLIAGLCSCDTRFPASASDLLIPQTVLTLNLLRASRRNPSLSAHSELWVIFYFNATPFSPPGTKVLVHLKTYQRKSVGTHEIDEWYIGPSWNHYRCYKCWMPETGGTRYADTV